jgi:hypothetical protein
MIGNELLFDLEFDISRVLDLTGDSLDGVPIHTYCAGLLVVCALRTSQPLEQFFPIREAAAGGKMQANLEKIGLSIGENFVSPTGALFSPSLRIVARCEPMYDPGRELQEAVFDRFAEGMSQSVLQFVPAVDQLLRQELARLAKENPWLAQALAWANNVNANMDLEAAARAAAVIEALDEIAEDNLNDFAAARQAIMAGTRDAAADAETDRESSQRREVLRRRHAELERRWSEGRLTPRQLRIALVDYYVQRGRRQVGERFFAASSGQ